MSKRRLNRGEMAAKYAIGWATVVGRYNECVSISDAKQAVWNGFIAGYEAHQKQVSNDARGSQKKVTK